MRRCFFALVILSTVASMAIPQSASKREAWLRSETKGPPTESEHRAGPRGLAGWTLNYVFTNGTEDKRPVVLVIADRGKVLRKIYGDPFIWRWIFWNDGRQLAYETGPLHFAMSCNLVDLSSAKVLDSVDCWKEIPDDAPAWLKALERPH